MLRDNNKKLVCHLDFNTDQNSKLLWWNNFLFIFLFNPTLQESIDYFGEIKTRYPFNEINTTKSQFMIYIRTFSWFVLLVHLFFLLSKVRIVLGLWRIKKENAESWSQIRGKECQFYKTNTHGNSFHTETENA